MFIKKLIRKQVKKMVVEELEKTSVKLECKNIRIKIKHDGETYVAKLKIYNDTIDISNFEKEEVHE